MSILKELAAKKSGTTSGRPAAREDRPTAQTWMNVGYEVNGKFVNLPLGLPIDTMEPVVVRGQDPDWIGLQMARNSLLKEIQAAGDELEPGAEIVIPLEIRIRRVNAAVELSEDDNPYSMANAGLQLTKA